MAELDPLTNLPKEKTDPVEEARKARTKVSKNGKAGKTFDAIDAQRTKRRTPDMGIQRVPGAFGEYGDVSVTRDRNFNEIRAQAQTFTELAGKTIAQTTGTVAGMGLEAVGFLGDIPMAVASMVSDSEMDFERNIISKAGNYLEEKTREMFPVYKTQDVLDGEASRFLDATYWATHIPSIASTLSLMVPAGAIARGAAYAARAARIGKLGQQGVATVSAALSSRHMEGMLEAYESFETDYQRAIDNGLTDAEAKQFAGESAANTYKLGYSNLVMDGLQWGALLRGFNFASRGVKGSIAELGEQSGSQMMKTISRTLKRNPNMALKDAVKKSGFSWRDYLAQAGMEGYEEFNQEFIKRLSSHNADIAMGLTEGSPMGYGEAMFSGLMGEHLQDSETWDAALMGFLGGAVFQGAGQLYSTKWNRNQEQDKARRLKSEQEKLHYIKNTLGNIQNAVKRGDSIAAQKERESLIFNLAINGMSTPNAEFDGAAIEGTMANTKEMFEAIENMTSEDLASMDLTEESKQEAKQVLEELNNIETKLNNFYNKTNTGTRHDAAISVMLAESSYRLEKGRERIAEIESLIEQEKVDNPVLNDALTPLKATQNQLLDLKSQLEAKKDAYRALKNAQQDPNPYGQAPFRVKATKKIRKETLQQLEQEMTELSQEISNMIPKNQRNKVLAFGEEFTPQIEDMSEDATFDLNKNDIDQVNNIIENYVSGGDNLRQYYQHKEIQQIENLENEKHQQNLLSNDYQQQVIESLEKGGKKLRQEAVTRAIKAKHGDNSYLNQDGRIFRIRHTEEGVELQEVDRQLEPVEDGEFKTITDPDRLENVFNAQPIEQTFTEEQFEEFKKDYQEMLDNRDFANAFQIVSDVLFKSNYGDRAVQAAKTYLEAFNEFINEVDSFNELKRTYNEIIDLYPGAEFRDFINNELEFNFYQDIYRQTVQRAEYLTEQYQIELNALNKALDIKTKKLQKTEQDLEKLPEQLETFKKDVQQQIDQIFNDLIQEEDKGLIEDLDRRTKPAKQIEALEKSIAQKAQEIKEERTSIKEQQKQLQKDIHILQDLKAKLGHIDAPSVLVNQEIQDMLGIMDGVRAKLLLQADITEEQTETMQERYADLEQELETAITAIEKFHAYVKTLDDSGKLLKRASNKAYNQLVERGILSGNETMFVGVGEQVFAEYRRLFNKAITDILRDQPYLDSSVYTPALRRLLNENRLTENIQGANVNYWATFAIDYPLQSELFNDEALTSAREAQIALGRYRNALRKLGPYQNILSYLQREYEKKRISVSPKDLSTKSDPTDDDLNTEGFENPQRTENTAFTRPSGNSGTNSNPNSDPSQRRYFRYINKTDFEDKQHNLKIVKPEGQFELDIPVPEKYNKDDILLSIITDADGKYIDENGDTFEEFDKDRALYTTMPLPTYDTLNEYGRTFTPSERYLKKNYEGKTTEQRLANYEKQKEKSLNEYKTLREQWIESIEEEGFATQAIIGKSLGVPFQIDKHHQYSEGVEPNSLSNVFEDPTNLIMLVNTDGYVDHYGETVYMPKGGVVIRDPNTGNIFEGAVRRLNDSEALTIINALKTYVRQSTLENGRLNQTDEQKELAGLLRDNDGNILSKSALAVFKDYLNAFDQRKGKAPIDFIRTKQAQEIPGGQMRVGEKAIDLLANDPETGQKIQQINPELVDVLREYLNERLFNVRSDLLNGQKSKQGFTKVEYKDGGFTESSYDTYKDFLLQDEVVGTWLQSAEDTQMTVETDGAVEPEEAYQFFNQQPIYNVPSLDQTQQPVDNADVIESLDDIAEGTTIYATPLDPADDTILKITKDDGIEVEAINKEAFSQKDAIAAIEELDNGNYQFTENPNKTQEAPTPEPKPAKQEKKKNLSERLGKLERKTEETEDGPNPDEAPFQRTIVGGKKLTQQGFQELSRRLEVATGIPTVYLTEKQAVAFLQDLKERRYHNTDFTEDNIPYGMYHEGVAYVFGPDISPETVFHEVSHAVVYQIIDQNPELAEQILEDLVETEEGQKIIEHVATNYPNAVVDQKITPQGAAEVITTAMGRSAQRKYLQKNEEYQGIINRILDAIRRFFREIFGQDIRVNELTLETTIDDLADIFVNGESIQLTPNLIDTNFSKRPSMMVGESEMVFPGRTVQFTQDSLNMLNHQFFHQLFNKHPERLATIFSSDPDKSLYSDIMNGIYNDLYDKAEDFLESNIQDTERENEIENIIYLLENWNKTLDLHSKNLQKFSLDVITEETLETETERNTNRLWQEEAIKFSAKQNATSSIRQLIGSLQSRKSNKTYPTMPENVDFGKAFNLLANHMAGSTTLEQKKKILEDLQGQDGMQDLMNRLFSKDIQQMTQDDLATAMYLLEFNRTFSKHFAEYKLVFNDQSNTFKAVDATVNSGKKRLLQEWESSVLLRGDLYKLEDGRKVYKTEYFKSKYPDKYDEDGKLLKRFIITRDIELNEEYERKLEDVQPKDQPRYRQYYKTLQFLEDLGVNITAEVPADEKFNKAAQATLNLIKKGTTPDIFAPDSDVRGNLDMFAQHQVDHAKDFVENQHQNIDGETVYNVVLNHYVSMVQDKINNASTLEELQQELPHLFDTPYTERSILLNRAHNTSKLYTKLFDGQGKRKENSNNLKEQKNLLIDITEGVKNKDQSVPFNQLSYGDKVQLALNSALKGRFSIFRAGDKKLERYMELGEIFTNSQINNNEHHKLFMNYLVDELLFISDIQTKEDSYKGEDNITEDFDNTILPALLASNRSLKTKMQEALETGSIEALAVDPEFVRIAGNTLNRYFDSQVDKAREYIQDFLIVEKDNDTYKNNGLLGLTDNEGVAYDQSQLDAILKTIIVNRSVANIEQTKLFTGHPAYYGDSNNFFHRMSGALGTKNISSVGHMENQILEKFFEQPRLYKYYDSQSEEWVTTEEYQEGYKPIMRTVVFADPRVQTRYEKAIKDSGVSVDVYNDMEESDAMGLVSLQTYRDMKLRAGEWSQALERLYKWETRLEGVDQIQIRNWTTGKMETVREQDLTNPDGSRTTFNMIKPQYFGPLAEQGFVPGMYKLAVMPVLPSYTNEAMVQLREYMEDSNVGLVTFESANKVGVKNPGQQLYSSEGTPDFSNVTPQDSFYEYWGIQLETGNKVKDEVILGSQFLKQIFSGIFNRGEAFNEELGQAATELTQTHKALIEEGKQELREELGLKLNKSGNYTVDSVKSLINFLQTEAGKREANNNVIDGLGDLESYIDGNLGLDVLSNRDKIENILASLADSRVISQKVHGGAKIQASSTFFENDSRVKAGDRWLSQEDLKFYEDGTLEVYMPHYFKELLGERDVSDVEEDLLNAIGFRIPTSGMNVIENIKIKGFLPQTAGDTIVLPSEIVAKAGSDFDVDKLQVLLPNYKMVDGQPQYIEFFSSAREAATYIQSLGKELADKTGRTPKKSAIKKELINRGYPKLADTLGKKLKNPSIRDMNSKEAIQNRFIELSSQILTNEGVQKNKFTPIGIDILETIKKEVDNLRGEPSETVGFADMLFDFEYGAKITQRNVESIAGTGIAALHVSDHVHATRYNYQMNKKHSLALKHNEVDGKISLGSAYDANGKHEIGNLLNQITNMFIDGVKNPISFSLNLNLETVGPALYMLRAGVPINQVFYMLNQPIIRDYINLKRVKKSFVNRGDEVIGRNDIGKRLTAKYGSSTSTDRITESRLKQSLKNVDNKFQKQILGEYKSIEQSAQVLSQYIQSTRIDTVAMGKNTSQLDLMLNSLEKIENNESGIIGTTKLLSEEDNGFLAPHYQALKDFREMFQPFFYHLSDNSAMNMYEDVVSFIEPKQISMEEKVAVLDKFKLDLMTYQILTNPVDINGNLVQPISERKDLMIGENSLPKRILKIKQEGTDNLLLEYLMPIIGKEEINGALYDSLKLIDQRMDVFEQNALIEAWRDLFFEQPQLASDLVQFTMLQNGLQLSPMTFTKFIPSEVYMKMINSAFENGMDINEDYFLEKFIGNNYNDPNLVPTKWFNQNMRGKDIYKFFELKEGIKKEEVSDLFKKGIFPYKPIPTIVVNKKGVQFGDRVLFADGKNFKPRGFKDYRNNRAYLSYGSETAPQVAPEKQSLSKEQIESLTNRKSIDPKQENDNIKNCS